MKTPLFDSVPLTIELPSVILDYVAKQADKAGISVADYLSISVCSNFWYAILNPQVFAGIPPTVDQ